jgi:hypothetical protein
MEVHHHAHTPGKKWTHYLWEFLMLFLAVFCGFLAEYQLEHKLEKDRAGELAVSFYDELKGDSTEMQLVIKYRLRKDSSIMYLYDYFLDSNIKNLPKIFGINYTMAFMVNSPIIFEPHGAILDQLKNSGSLRYFKSKKLQVLTGELSVTIANLKARNEVEQDFFNELIMPFLIKHNDHQWIKKIRGNGQKLLRENLEDYKNDSVNIPFHLGNPEQFNKSETMNMIQTFLLIIQTTRINQYKTYVDKNHMLLDELRKQYHLN